MGCSWWGRPRCYTYRRLGRPVSHIVIVGWQVLPDRVKDGCSQSNLEGAAVYGAQRTSLSRTLHIAKPAPNVPGSCRDSVWLRKATLHAWDGMGRDAVGQTGPAVIEGMVSLSQDHRLQPPLFAFIRRSGGFFWPLASARCQSPVPYSDSSIFPDP